MDWLKKPAAILPARNGYIRTASPSPSLLHFDEEFHLEDHPSFKERQTSPIPTGFSKTDEQPRPATTKTFQLALLRCLIHVPPIAITLGVLSLTFRSVFWTYEESVLFSETLNAIQFGAKAHEIMIVLSLGSIQLHRLQYDLVSSDGVPLGLLGPAYSLGSFGYMFSTEFWNGVCTRGRRWPARLPLLALIALTSFLAATCGPSSAIAMIPRLQWWRFDPAHYASTNQTSVYVQSPLGTAFPQTISRGNLPDYCYGASAASFLECPAGGGFQILGSALSLYTDDSDRLVQTPPLKANITVQTVNSLLRSVSGEGDSVLNVNTASTSPDFIPSCIWHGGASWFDSLVYPRIEALMGSKDAPQEPAKPITQTQCLGFDPSSPEIYFPHDGFTFVPWTTDAAYQNANWTMKNPALDAASQNATTLNFTWVDLSAGNSVAPSLAGVFVFNNYSVACTLDAHWLREMIWLLEPQIDPWIYEAGANLNALTADTDTPAAVSEQTPLHIDLDWAAALDVPVPVPNLDSSPGTSMIEALGGMCTALYDADPSAVAPCMGMLLGLYVTDGLARLQSTWPMFTMNSHGVGNFSLGHTTDNTLPSPETHLPSFENMTEVSLLFYQFGYGYGLGSTTIRLSVAVLLLHVVLAAVHVVVLFVGGGSTIGA